VLPRRHALNLLLLAIPWVVIVIGILRGSGARGGVLEIGDLSFFFARLAVGAYALEACIATLLIAALNWSRLRPGSTTAVYWLFALPAILLGLLSLPSALGSARGH